MNSLSYRTIFSESTDKNAAQTWYRELCSYLPEELWAKQGLGNLCTFWIMPKQPLTKRHVDETSAVNYPRGWLSSLKVSGQRDQIWSTPNRRVSQRTHPQDTIAIPHRRCGGSHLIHIHMHIHIPIHTHIHVIIYNQVYIYKHM